MMGNPVDLVVTNGKIITVDGGFSIAEAVAVRGERIAAIGGAAEILALTGPETRVIDAAGKAVIPGLIDGHSHMDREGLKPVFPSLAGCESIDDVLQRIKALADNAAPGEWIVTMPIGEPPYYWDTPNNLREKRYPTRWELDQAAPDNPVYIRPIWGYWRHIQPLDSVANSRALEIAGIGSNFVSPSAEIEFERDEKSGDYNGVIHEWTYMPIAELSLFRMAPGFSHDDRVAGIRRAMTILNSTATTSVLEEHGAARDLIQAYQEVNQAGDATVRAHLVFSPSWGGMEKPDYARVLADWGGWLGGRGLGDDMLRVSGMYTEFGISPESALRATSSPYTGWSGFKYDCGVPRERMKEFMIEAARNKIRICTITMNYLDLYEEVDREVPIGDMRWVIGHLDRVTEDQAKRIADLGVAMTTHTNRYIYKQSHIMRDEIGAENEDQIVPLRMLLDAGVPVGLATDNVPTTLFYPIWQAVSRHNMHIDAPVGLGQRLSREQALHCATMGGAYLTFEEDNKGSLEPGKLADLAVLTDDPLSCAESDIKDIKAETTIVGGRVVYQRGGQSGEEAS
jgi:predicted amidohydrolase YtcJ